jgi:hypothetical protein
MCFVLPNITGFAARYVAPMLSHQMTAVLGACIPMSCNNDCTYMVSAMVLAKALHSASVLDHETVGCFLALHETRLQPKNIASPPVDLLSST